MATLTKVSVNGQVYDLGGGGGGKMVEITYAQLKELVDASGLTPGNQYRITDFVSIFNENVKSANHPFDLIVTASSVNTFYPKAEAAKHEGDDYFVNCDLSAWEIWYDFNNDTSKYYFANENTGKGFIYRMIDENNNDVNYDFKNLLITIKPHYFHSAFESNEGEVYLYTFSYIEDITPNDFANPMDFSIQSFGECKDNIIRMTHISSDPFNNGGGIVLGIVKGLVYNNSRIVKNNIAGSFFAFCKNALMPGIYENISFSKFVVKVLSDSVYDNILNFQEFQIGPQNWEESTHSVILGSIYHNFFMGNLLVYGQDKDNISFCRNIVKVKNDSGNDRILQKESIKKCEIIGYLDYLGVEILEEQEGKLIVGKGETVSIIDPSTFYS